MIFIWGIMVFACLLFLPFLAAIVLIGIVDVFRAIFGKNDENTNNSKGYCRDLQREISAEYNRNT